MTSAVTSFFGTASKLVNPALPSVRFEWLSFQYLFYQKCFCSFMWDIGWICLLIFKGPAMMTFWITFNNQWRQESKVNQINVCKICLLRSKKVAGCVWVPIVLSFAHLQLAKLGQRSWFTHTKWKVGLRDIFYQESTVFLLIYLLTTVSLLKLLGLLPLATIWHYSNTRDRVQM